MQRIIVDSAGRVVIPAAIRRELSLRPGVELVASIEDGRLVLETRDATWSRLRRLFSEAAPDHSVVGELLEERRAEGRPDSKD